MRSGRDYGVVHLYPVYSRECERAASAASWMIDKLEQKRRYCDCVRHQLGQLEQSVHSQLQPERRLYSLTMNWFDVTAHPPATARLSLSYDD